MNPPILSVSNVSVKYGTRTILDQLNAEVGHGEIIALVGPNGCGKSTLLKTILGLLQPTSGSILIAGREAASWKRKELASFLSYLPQSAQSHWDLRVQEIIQLGLAHNITNTHPASSINWPAFRSLYELDDLYHRRFHSLSGGEKSRVMLAMSMIRQPKLLLADEPTASLDINHAMHVLGLLNARKQKTTVLLVIHDLNLALTHADKIWVLDHGKIVLNGKPETILRDPQVDHVFRTSFHRHTCSGRLVLVPTSPSHDVRTCEF